MSTINDSTIRYAGWLAKQLEGRGGIDAAALTAKYVKMKEEGRHTFLRATFYRWAERWKDAEPDARRVLSAGDVHVENFGTWRSAKNELVWGINDADEACRLPWTSDLVRLGVSVQLALNENSVAGADPAAACEKVLRGYTQGMQEESSGALIITNDHPLSRLVNEIILDDSLKKFWKDEDAKKQEAKSLPDGVLEILKAALPAEISRPIQEPTPQEPPGTGSMGKRRFYASALTGDDRVMREAKPAVPSALIWARSLEGNGEMPDDGSTAALLDSPHRIPDPTQRLDRGWIVRGISRDAGKMKFKKLAAKDATLSELECLLDCMGRELAGLHHSGVNSGAREAIIKDLSARGSDGVWFREAVAEHAGLTETDWSAFMSPASP